MLRDFLIALSLSNLCFLRIWNELFNGKLTYYAQGTPTHHLLAVVLNVLLLALVFNTALLGWYHPYCRVLGASLNFCAWHDGPLLRGEVRTPQEAAAWLDQHRSLGDSPYNVYPGAK
jgi:cytochrome b561